MTPFFSIIIPVYNVAPYLRECLDSVEQQTFADWECICIDDGSTDESGKILDEYGSMDARFRIVHKKNEGVSIARNVGMNMALGEYFMFVDGDDSITKDALKSFARVLKEFTVDCVLINPFLSKEGDAEPIRMLEPDIAPLQLLIGSHAAGGWPFCRVYRRKKFGALRFIPGMRLREDMCFWSDALCVPANFCVVSKPFYRYRQRPESASKGVTWKTSEDLLLYPSYVIRNMREKMNASDDDVKRFWEIEVKTLALDPYFLSWRNVDFEARGRMLCLYDDVITSLGYNPNDFMMRFCVTCARHKLVRRLVPLAYFIRRCAKKIGLV